MFSPTVSYAREIDYLQSFGNGIDTLKGETTSEQVTPERDFMEHYEPQEVVLSSPPAREYDEDSTTVDYVNGTLDSFNTVPWNVGGKSLLDSVRLLFANVANSTGFLLSAVGLVFMWWGVRKSVRMIMGAWRKGNQSV